MKAILSLLVFALMGCSRAYISNWSGGEVTACCPTRLILCTQNKLSELATEQCSGPAKPVSGGAIESGASIVYGSGYARVQSNHDMCTTFRCQM